MKSKYLLLLYVVNCFLFSLFLGASERRASMVLTPQMVETENEGQVFSVQHHWKSKPKSPQHIRASSELLSRGDRRRSLPTYKPKEANVSSFLSIKVESKSSKPRRLSHSSLHNISEHEQDFPDINKTVTSICALMNTSTENALGRAVSYGAELVYSRTSDKVGYLRSLEALAKTPKGQNKMMRSFLEAYQCKYDQVIKDAAKISKEERVARDRVVQSVRLEATQKVNEIAAKKTKWKRVALTSAGTAGAFGLIAIMQLFLR